VGGEATVGGASASAGSTSGGAATVAAGAPNAAGFACSAEPRSPDQFPVGTDADAIAWYVAGRRRGEALCGCALPSEPNLGGCVDEESFAPNAVCLSALVPSAPQRWRCWADVLQNEAACYEQGPCLGNGQYPNCTYMQDCAGAAYPELERFCRQRRCDPSAGPTVFPRQICDGVCDCPDGSDERNCTPGSHVFECNDGQLIEVEGVCDIEHLRDCADGSDELYCN
jgi:hypothetical protein